VYGDMDAVAHDGTVHMGFGGAPVVLNGPVILDLLVLRFSLLPAQGGSPPLPARGSKIKSGAHVVLRDLMVVILAEGSLWEGQAHRRLIVDETQMPVSSHNVGRN
jgi:hypothetical protein